MVLSTMSGTIRRLRRMKTKERRLLDSTLIRTFRGVTEAVTAG